MAVFDVEMTQHCLADHHCVEGNPLMPTSQAGALGVSLALVGSGAFISYKLKKQENEVVDAFPGGRDCGSHHRCRNRFCTPLARFAFCGFSSPNRLFEARRRIRDRFRPESGLLTDRIEPAQTVTDGQ